LHASLQIPPTIEHSSPPKTIAGSSKDGNTGNIVLRGIIESILSFFSDKGYAVHRNYYPPGFRLQMDLILVDLNKFAYVHSLDSTNFYDGSDQVDHFSPLIAFGLWRLCTISAPIKKMLEE